IIQFNSYAYGELSTQFSSSSNGVLQFDGYAFGVKEEMSEFESSSNGVLQFNGYAEGVKYETPPTTYTVVFKNYDGTTLKTVTNVAYEGYAPPPNTNPTRTGYTFAGWNSSAYQVVTQNETITATYTA